MDAYIHRIGRTGRAESRGEALTFIVRDDEPMVRSIENVLQDRIERRTIDGIDYAGIESTTPKSRSYSSRPGRYNQRRNGSGEQREDSDGRDNGSRRNGSNRGRGKEHSDLETQSRQPKRFRSKTNPADNSRKKFSRSADRLKR